MKRKKVMHAPEKIDELSSHIGKQKIIEALSITLRQGFLF